MINKNISFQGHTYLELNPHKFSNVISDINRCSRNLGIDNKCNLSNGKLFAATPDILNYAVIVRNHKNGFLKYVPLKENLSSVIDEIALKVDKLRESSKDKLTAWIIGGDRIDGKLGEKSVNTLNKIADVLCDKPDIDASILAGTKNRENIVIHTLNNVLEMTLEKPKKSSLEDMFDIVEINNTEII